MAAASRRKRSLRVLTRAAREPRLKRLLTIGHSYVVAQNRRLAHEMARQGEGRWEVTAAAPARLPGDLREIELEPIAGEACAVVPLNVWFGAHPHLRLYGRGLAPLVRQSWDIVHCWEEPYVLAAAQIARLVRPGVRFVPATFQNIAKRYPKPVQLIERRVMARADAWIAFGQTVCSTQRARDGYGAKRATIISPGVDVDVFRPNHAARMRIRERLGLTEGDTVVGFTGRFVAEKGVGTLLAALERSRSPWTLLLVGGGLMAGDIEQARRQYPSRIHVVTDVPHDDVPDYLNAMDLLCAPSRTTATWREQFGRMLIEAMACGVPVVASASGEIPHVVQDAGVLVAEDDVGAWSHEIDRLAADSAARAELGLRGLRRAREHFAWPVVAKSHLSFFETVIAQ